MSSHILGRTAIHKIRDAVLRLPSEGLHTAILLYGQPCSAFKVESTSTNLLTAWADCEGLLQLLIIAIFVRRRQHVQQPGAL
jgi:hypothetical protein